MQGQSVADVTVVELGRHGGRKRLSAHRRGVRALRQVASTSPEQYDVWRNNCESCTLPCTPTLIT